MLSAIQSKTTGHFFQAMDNFLQKLLEWFDSDYNNHMAMMNLDHEITAFVCLVDVYVTVVEGLAILRDSSESRRIFFRLR